MAEIIIFAFATLVAIAGGVAAHRYAKARVELARELMAAGWVQVGCDFIRGPILVPPPEEKGRERR